MTKLDFEGGKYTVIHENGCNFKALRYGEEWRDLVGDGLVLAIVQEHEDVLVENQRLRQALKQIIEIEFEQYGGDWDEIEQAQEIAKSALEYSGEVQ